MAWANHARCLHCGVRLPLYRKLTDGEFCSAQHRKAFQEDQSRMAVERLLETQKICNRVNSEVRAHVDREELVLQGPPIAGPVTVSVVSRPSATATMLALDPLAYDFASHPAVPKVRYDYAAPAPVRVEEASFDDPPIAGPVTVPVASQQGATAAMLALDPLAYDFASNPAVPKVPHGRAMPGLVRAAQASIGSLVKAVAGLRLAPPDPLAGRKQVHAEVARPPSGLKPVFEIQVAAMGEMRALPRIQPAVGKREAGRALQAVPVRVQTWLPLPQFELAETLSGSPIPELAGLRKLAMPPARVPAAIGSTTAAQPLRPVFGDVDIPDRPSPSSELRIAPLQQHCFAIGVPEPAGVAVRLTLPEPVPPATAHLQAMLPNRPPGKRPAARIRGNARLTRLQLRGPVEPPLTWGLKAIEWCAFPAGQVICPEHAPAAWTPMCSRDAAVAIPLGPGRDRQRASGYARKALSGPEPYRAKPLSPASRLRPLHLIHEIPRDVEALAARGAALSPAARLVRILRGRPMRMSLMMLPFLLLIAIWQNEQNTQAASPVTKFVNARLTEVKLAIQNRAGIELLDDFRTGLDNWDSGGDLTRSWSYDQTGFVKPGPLALYRPSLGLSEYSFEFLGQIDRGALGWVYRAQDMRNYHVAKLVVRRPGPLPTISLVRYSVIRGKETRRVETPLPLNVHKDTVYRVRMEARGADFSLYVQNQMVQFWSDWRLPAGGVGFFSGRGEQSRIRWMQVSHQYDAIGKLCAYFSPMAVVTYNLEPTMGARTK